MRGRRSCFRGDPSSNIDNTIVSTSFKSLPLSIFPPKNFPSKRPARQVGSDSAGNMTWTPPATWWVKRRRSRIIVRCTTRMTRNLPRLATKANLSPAGTSFPPALLLLHPLHRAFQPGLSQHLLLRNARLDDQQPGGGTNTAAPCHQGRTSQASVARSAFSRPRWRPTAPRPKEKTTTPIFRPLTTPDSRAADKRKRRFLRRSFLAPKRKA